MAVGINREKIAGKRGQATVELVIAFPLLICLVALCFNVMSYLNLCSEFDHLCGNAVRIFASSVEYDVKAKDSVTAIAQGIRENLGGDGVKVTVTTKTTSLGFSEYQMTLVYSPSLFGKSVRNSLFGISLPQLKHTCTYTIDTYTGSVI